MSNAVYIYIV